MIASQHEQVMAAGRVRLQAFASVRNRIAHASEYARQRFDQATMDFAARRYRGSFPGSFLRDWNHGAVPRERWIATIGGELKMLAVQIVA